MVGRLSTKFLLCLNQSGTASKRKSLQTEPFWHLLTSPRLSTRSGTLLCFINSRSNSSLVSFFAYAPSCLTVELKSRSVVSAAFPFASDEGSPRARYLVQSSSSCLLMTSPRIYLGVPMPLCMLTIWSSSQDPLKASSVVQSSLTVLETWSNLWRFPLNPKKCESSFFSTDPHQTTFQAPAERLNLLGIPLLFNPIPKFLGVTFDRNLFFGAHVQSLCSKFYPRHKALLSIATASWGPTKESLSLLYKAFVRPVLNCSHMPLLDGFDSSATPQPNTWKSYTEVRAGLLLGASLPPLLPTSS